MALEMARQLRAADEDIECLILLDARWDHLPARDLLRDDRIAVAAILREAAVRAGLNSVDGLEQALAGTSMDGILQNGLAWAQRVGALPRGLGTHALRRRLAVLRAHLGALSKYRPRPYSGATLFFEACDSESAERRADEDWDACATPSWRVEVVQGTHDSILTGAGALHIANRLRALFSPAPCAAAAPR